MQHREEREFSIHLHLLAEFAADYEGDEDGFVWFERFERELKPRLLSAITDVLRTSPEWEAIVAPRGRDPELALELSLKKRIGDAP